MEYQNIYGQTIFTVETKKCEVLRKIETLKKEVEEYYKKYFQAKMQLLEDEKEFLDVESGKIKDMIIL